jgi:hypothetical protein
MSRAGFTDGKIVERFDCYAGTPAKAKLSQDFDLQGVNFFARKIVDSGAYPADSACNG